MKKPPKNPGKLPAKAREEPSVDIRIPPARRTRGGAVIAKFAKDEFLPLEGNIADRYRRREGGDAWHTPRRPRLDELDHERQD